MSTLQPTPRSGELPQALYRTPRRGALLQAPFVLLAFVVLVFLACPRQCSAAPPDEIILNDDGGWCWFEDPRVIIHSGKLVVGTVANGAHDASRRGDIEVTSYDFDSGKIVRNVLHKNLQADDHDSPALQILPDGRWLAFYCKHGNDQRIYRRISTRPNDPTEWQAEQVFIPDSSSRATYSNLHWLQRENSGKGRVYNFFRGYCATSKPSWMFSDDAGQTWNMGGLLIDFPAKRKHRPYVKYVSNGKDTVHFTFTEGHPNEFDNSLYYAFYRNGQLWQAERTPVRALQQGPLCPAEATLIFKGDSNNVAWPHCVALDAKGHPRIVYSVQKDSGAHPRYYGGHDLRYRFARWDGSKWHDREIAYAGSRLYAGEDDYAGGIYLHPDDPNTVFISTNVDPVTGTSVNADVTVGPQCSEAATTRTSNTVTGALSSPSPPQRSVEERAGERRLIERRYEIYRGQTSDNGKTWTWTPITQNSTSDNLRPIIPSWSKDKTALLWLRGTYSAYTNYKLEVVLKVFDCR